MVIATVYDSADPSVGLFSTQYSIECPFDISSKDEDYVEYFRQKIQELYKEFAIGRIIVEFDFEKPEQELSFQQ